MMKEAPMRNALREGSRPRTSPVYRLARWAPWLGLASGKPLEAERRRGSVACRAARRAMVVNDSCGEVLSDLFRPVRLLCGACVSIARPAAVLRAGARLEIAAGATRNPPGVAPERLRIVVEKPSGVGLAGSGDG